MVLDNVGVLHGSMSVGDVLICFGGVSYIKIFEKVNFKLLHRMLAYQTNVEKDCIPYHDDAQFTLGKIRQFNLLDGDSLPGIPIQRAIHGTESALAQAVSQLLPSTPKVSICSFKVASFLGFHPTHPLPQTAF